VHYLLTGNKVMGIGEASGMFPIDSKSLNYDEDMLKKFNELEEVKAYNFDLNNLLPKVLVAGEDAGTLTKQGALFLDPSGEFEEGIKVVPCEGDAGTGMVATNSVRAGIGNVSAGTSDFAMVVVDELPKVHREIDMVTTPSGKPVAMVHCNNCTSDINAWANIVKELLEAFGYSVDTSTLFTTLFNKALEADKDAGGMISFNYYSGEGVTNFDEGRIVQLRKADNKFNLANLMRNNLMSALATLKIGLDILINEEGVKIDKLYGHGGYFKTPTVGQTILSAACNSPVSVMKTAGEGGPYGMALLCAYSMWRDDNESLEDYLDNKVFKNCESITLTATKEDVEGFNKYLDTYKKALAVQECAIENY
ncbi:MAG: ATPase, partial [Firmicutes bacterium]|nr:ATPase [Candidatus Colivicinus equi]